MNNENLQEVEEIILENKVEDLENQNDNQEVITIDSESNNIDKTLLENEIKNVLENEGYSLEDFNTISTTEGELKLNEQLFLELKTTNVYLNLIFLSVVVCFLYYVISKALKKLFYINI